MSEYQDKQLTCVECGGTFVWSAGDQEFFRDRGYSEPRRCKACRQARKEHRGGGFRKDKAWVK